VIGAGTSRSGQAVVMRDAPDSDVTAELVVSLSGISARTLPRCAELAEELDRQGVALSLLFAPRIGGNEHAGQVVDWVRARRSRGDALLLHGFDHATGPRRVPVPPSRRAEFAALPAHEAGLRLTAAKRWMERLGVWTDWFAPPGWSASRGTLTALRKQGFSLCADATAVRDIRSGQVHKGTVLGLRHGGPAESWWCFALVLRTARMARRGGLVRLAVDAADLARPGARSALFDAVEVARQHGADPTTYGRFAVGGASNPVGQPDRQRSVGSRSVSTRTSVPDGASSLNRP
jgi:predicted deacetylase